MTTREGSAKQCKQCGTVKPLELFHRDRKRRDGRNSICACCANALQVIQRRASGYRQKDKRRRVYGGAYAKKQREYQRTYRQTPLGKLNHELSDIRIRLRKWRVTAKARERRYTRIIAEILERREQIHRERSKQQR